METPSYAKVTKRHRHGVVDSGLLELEDKPLEDEVGEVHLEVAPSHKKKQMK